MNLTTKIHWINWWMNFYFKWSWNFKRDTPAEFFFFLNFAVQGIAPGSLQCLSYKFHSLARKKIFKEIIIQQFATCNLKWNFLLVTFWTNRLYFPVKVFMKIHGNILENRRFFKVRWWEYYMVIEGNSSETFFSGMHLIRQKGLLRFLTIIKGR